MEQKIKQLIKLYESEQKNLQIEGNAVGSDFHEGASMAIDGFIEVLRLLITCE